MQKLILICSVFTLIACNQNDMLPTQSILAIEGWIENDNYPIVMVTKTLVVGTEEYNWNNLEDYIVKWAKVSIINHKDTVVLTGKYDKGYFPPYIYTTGRMKGKIGETYKLLVEYDNLSAVATTTIQAPPEIDTYKVEKCIDPDTLYQIKACMDLTNHQTDYYQFFVRIGTKKKQYLASFLGNLDCSSSKQNIEFPVYRGHDKGILSDNKEYTPYYSIHDTVAVKCCSLDRMEYNFWRSYIESEYLSGGAMLGTTNNLPSNIIGGTGYWFGYGSKTTYFIIKDYAK